MTDPFRYRPHPLVIKAARETAEFISSRPELEEEFRKGKMIGILVYKDRDNTTGYLAAFSGNVGGRNKIEGFVPPIYDLLDPDGTFKKGEAELNALNTVIASLESSPEYAGIKESLEVAEKEASEDIMMFRARMDLSKRERDAIRNETDDASRHEDLIRQSQHEKAEFKRRKEEWNRKIGGLKNELERYSSEIRRLKEERALLSDRLQKWIFGKFIVHNALGESRSIAEIFAAEGLTPPGGTGECAAPKLLEHAFRNNLEPVAMGEFWYGENSHTAVRLHGHFYPSCTSKCGPLLRFMMQGLELGKEDKMIPEPKIIHIDDSIIAVSKPSGMPSVKGLDGRISLEEKLSAYGAIPVHRLDMDTSGIMVFARNEAAANHLRRQFETHTIRKTYTARLVPATGNPTLLKDGETGKIQLPMSPDYDERPRQKVDTTQGRETLTTYCVVSPSDDIAAENICHPATTEIEFHPHTGRTHQLRVHSAHSDGLARPICGDMLYGGCGSLYYDNQASRLCLHASRIDLIHPDTLKEIHFETDTFRY